MEILYDSIGSNYNATRVADPYIAKRFYENVVSEKYGVYLDIGCGTGNYTIALANKGLKVYGIDPSKKMLEVARQRSQEIIWLTGTAEALPVENNMFDGIFGMLTLHHWTHFETAFTELYRVLKSGSMVTFFTSSPEQMRGYWLNHYFPKMLADSIQQMPLPDKIYSAAEKAGFEVLEPEKYFVSDDLQDHFLYVGKNRPQLYLDEKIRNGISSFAALSNIEEVKRGLSKLKEDIDTGDFTAVKDSYNNTGGDYLFLKIHKV